MAVCSLVVWACSGMLSPAWVHNGVKCGELEAANRGLAYGDGLFETVLLKRGEPLWLLEHVDRLESGLKVIGIQLDRGLISSEIESELSRHQGQSAILKIIVYRKNTGRGYCPDTHVGERLLMVSAGPSENSNWHGGVKLAICQTPLATQTRLAGVKHLNRLEQVLAASELKQRRVDEGLMFTRDGKLIEATKSNVFLVNNNRLFTPVLDEAGVAGIMRDKILRYAATSGLAVVQTRLGVSDLREADEVFVCNSVFGIWPVTAIECYQKNIGPVSRQLQKEFEELFLD